MNATPPVFQSRFLLPKMDCSSEENLVRMAMGGKEGIHTLDFNLPARELRVVHTAPADQVLAALTPLNLGATLQGTALEASTPGLHRTLFAVPMMDCSSEENLIRLAFAQEHGIWALDFDLQKRELTVLHEGGTERLLERLQPLNLGAKVVSSEATEAAATIAAPDHRSEARILRLLLGINGAMFLIELLMGILAQSTGLIADSLDMFADAAVFALALMAVGTTTARKLKTAHLAGWLQVILALAAIEEVVRRFFMGSDPDSRKMVGVAALALMANAVSLVLIAKRKNDGAHMKASYIFSANDVIANAGVVVAGFLVAWTGSPYPDLVIGTIIAVVVLNGARRILSLR